MREFDQVDVWDVSIVPNDDNQDIEHIRVIAASVSEVEQVVRGVKPGYRIANLSGSRNAYMKRSI